MVTLPQLQELWQVRIISKAAYILSQQPVFMTHVNILVVTVWNGLAHFPTFYQHQTIHVVSIISKDLRQSSLTTCLYHKSFNTFLPKSGGPILPCGLFRHSKEHSSVDIDIVLWFFFLTSGHIWLIKDRLWVGSWPRLQDTFTYQKRYAVFCSDSSSSS